MNRRLLYLMLSLFIITLFTGCWDRRELEKLGFIQAIGLDLAPQGNGITITAMIAIPSKLAGRPASSGGGPESGTFVITMDAPSIYEAFSRINTTVNLEVTLLQTYALLIGEEMAKAGVEKWVDNLVRFREMRRTMNIFICKGTSAEILKAKPTLEKNPGEYFRDLAYLSQSNGMFPNTTLNDFMIRYEAYGQENYAPLLEKYQRMEGTKPKQGDSQGKGGSDKKEPSGQKPETQDIRCIGSAIFKKDKMVGVFDNYESQVILLLTNTFSQAFLTMPDPLKKNTFIVFRLISSSPVNIHYRQSNGDNLFKVKLKLEAELISIQSGINYTKPKMEALLSEKMGKILKNRIQSAIAKAQQLNSDVFDFGSPVRDTFITSTAWERYPWPDKFAEAKFDINVNVAIRRVGVQFQPPQNR